jgi:hypothetical protein
MRVAVPAVATLQPGYGVAILAEQTGCSRRRLDVSNGAPHPARTHENNVQGEERA